jgi:polysaccharide export outer membrane protein
MALKKLAWLVLALTLVPRGLAAQGPPAPSAATQTATTEGRAGTPEGYVIGPQDQLRITVFDEPELSSTYRVDDSGAITFPLVGRIIAGGRTLQDFQDDLRAQLASGFIRNPQVRVDIDQFKSQYVMVVGEVRSAGKIPMTGASMTLLEALVAAGSPTAQASNEIIVRHRPTEPGKEGEEVRINRRDLELGKKDLLLRDGDIINVPTAQRFYVSGYVRNPGYYVLDPGMTVEQAIALAGGLTERGSDRRITAKRMVDGKLQSVGLRLDDKVEANDTIDIPARFF